MKTPLIYEEYLPWRLGQLRIKKGVSARDMSLSIGQNENYINHIENGKTFPSMQAFFYICEYLKITPRDFFDTENQNPSLLNELISLASKMDEEALRSLLGLLRCTEK